MPFDLSNLNKGARFFWDKGEKDEWVELRALPIDELKKIRKQCVKKGIEYKNNKRGVINRIEFEETNEDLFNELMWDYVITAWRVVDPKGKEIPCTKANKLALMGGSIEFAKWVTESLEKLNEDGATIQEAEAKNSSTTQND